MSVILRGVTTNAAGGTLAIPAGVMAGDLLVVYLRSFGQYGLDATPFSGPPGWAQVTNMVWGSPNSGTEPGSTWGAGTFVRTADGTEGASVTWTAPEGEAIVGALAAFGSDTAAPLVSAAAGTASGPWMNLFTHAYTYPTSIPPGGIVAWVLSGHGPTITAYSGFTGTRTHHATMTLHSDRAFSTMVPPSGAPYYFERDRDMVISFDTEAGTLAPGERTAVSSYAWGLYPPGSSYAGDGVYWQVNAVTVAEAEAPPPAVGDWHAWVID